MSTLTTRHFLNALRKRDRLLATPTRGMWQEDAEFLQKYAADIDIQGQLSNTELSHSVPSFFQRPIQFYRSLSSESNPLHVAVTQEWRGLMAVFALANWLELELEARHFKVRPLDPDASSTVGTTGNGSLHIDTILRGQLPNPKHWSEWWMIYCSGSLLGATSPWTVVYTAAQSAPPVGIPWQRDGLLIDPVDHYDPDENRNPRELAILHAWVVDALANRGTWQMPAELGIQENVIADALRAWQDKLDRYADANLRIQTHPAIFGDSMFSSILRQPERFEGHDSDLFLQSSRPEKSRVLAFSEKLSKDKRVYRGVFAHDVNIEDLNAEGTEFATRAGRTIPFEYVVAERLFLSDKLVALQLSPSAYRGTSTVLSTPLTPAFFRYFSYEDFVRDPHRLSLLKVGDTYKVTLQLPVSSGTLAVERVYGEQDIVRLHTGTPGFGVWPDFQTPSWKENFAAYAAPAGDDLVVTPVFTDGSQSPHEARNNVHQKEVRIWPSEKACIGFGLEWFDDAHETYRAGMVLRAAMPGPQPLIRKLTWDVGVDFGTSSTTVMMSRNGGAIDPLQFKGRTVFLTAPEREASARLETIENNLYPSPTAVPTPPFPTLLYESAATVFDLHDSGYTLRFTGDAAKDVANKPVRNVKWGRQSGYSGDTPLLAYLRGIVRYLACEAMAEGVESLNFRWSYPLSLPVGSLTKMTSFWAQQVKSRYSVREGLQVEVGEGVSESEAVCRCLAAGVLNNIRGNGLVIAIDVGGGSTDIALWSAQTLLDQFSFKIAGNDILDPSYLNERSLKCLFEACWHKQVPGEELAAIRLRPEIYVNRALTAVKDSSGATIQNPWRHPLPGYIHGGQEDKFPWIHFRSMIYLYFSGLAYYLGTHTRILESVEDPFIEVYIGGRGSAGLTWLAADSSLLQEVLTDAFLRGLRAEIKVGDDNVTKYKHRDNVKIEFLGSPIAHKDIYPSLKTEVARGLLLPLKLTVEPGVGVVIGEVGWHLNNPQKPEPWGKELDAKEMSMLKPPQDFNSCHIGDFVSWLRQDAKKFLQRLNLDAEGLPKIWPNSPSVQNQMKQSAEGDDHVLQPLFGYELKDLMHQYAQLVEKSAKTQSAIA